MKRVTVFCASSRQADEKYFEAARHLASIMVKNGVTVVYGGGAVGLMGALADYMLAHGGDIEGVIPGFMIKVEWNHKGVKRMRITKDMHERKKLLIRDADAVVALPGGSGTLEELMEVISMKRLGKFTKPIIILNTGGFYNPLVEMLQRMVDEKFMHPDHLAMWRVIDTPDELMEAIAHSVQWDEGALDRAGL